MLAHVFKIVMDPYVGKMAVFRIHQGTVTRDSQLYIGDARQPFKVAHLLLLQGKEHEEVPRAGPGDICAVAKIDEIGFDAVLHDATEDGNIHLIPLEFPTPIYGLAIEPARGAATSSAWPKCCTSSPRRTRACASNTRPAPTKPCCLGLGEFHLRCMLERLTDQYKLEVITRPPRDCLSRDHQRFGRRPSPAQEADRRRRPVRRGDAARGAAAARHGLRVRRCRQGGRDSRTVHPGRGKGIRQALDCGPLAGFPMQDVRVTVLDGKSHPVDSKEVAFATAGRKAFVDAVLKARPSVLEPVVDIEVMMPDSTMGDVIGDLSSKRGQVHGTRTGAANTVIVAGKVPLSELNDYQSRLNSLTGGHGSYTIQFSHYEGVPPGSRTRWRPSTRLRSITGDDGA
ncbi:hypothetical protein ACTMU2_10915 [Cupriavidus basilensis]